MRINLLTNPSFETDTQGWEVGGGTLTVSTAEHYDGTRSGKFQSATSGVPHINQAYLTTPIEPSTEYTFSAYVKVPALLAQGYNMYAEFYDNFTDWNYLGGSYGDWFNGATIGWERRSVTFTTPAGCHGAIVYIIADSASAVSTDVIYIDNCLLEKGGLQPYFDGDTPGFAWDGQQDNSTSSTDLLFNVGQHLRLEVETSSGVWTDITGPTTTASINYDDASVGTLKAEVLDATLDPVTSSSLALNKQVRLKATNVGNYGTQDVLYTGRIDNLAVKRLPREKHKVSISLSAANNVTYLSGQSEPRGVATMDELRWLVTGVPFNINGNTSSLGSGTVVSKNDNASIWDEVLLTRDSVLGYAWVDKNNVVQGWDASSIDATSKATLGPDVYTDLDIEFDLTQVINSVTVNFMRYNIGTETASAVPYGPYTDATSIASWGARSADFTIVGGTEDAGAISTYANDILSRNSTAEHRPTTAYLNIYKVHDLKPVHKVGLNSTVTVIYQDGTTTKDVRVVAMRYVFGTDGSTVEYDFAPTSSVSVPSSGASSSVGYVPDGSVGSDQLSDDVNDTFVSLQEQVDDALAAANDAADFAATKMQVFRQTTVPTYSGDANSAMWIDTDDGNKPYIWDGTAFTAATAGNLLSPNGRLYVDSTGLYGKDSGGTIKTSLDAGTGLFYTAGPIISGGDVSGATVTGGTVQSTSTANRGIKLNSSYLIAYDSGGSPTLSIDASTGAITMKGSLTSGSSITGATITGGTLETGSSGVSRVKVASDNVQFINSSNVIKGQISNNGSQMSISCPSGLVFSGGDISTTTGQGFTVNGAGLRAMGSGSFLRTDGYLIVTGDTTVYGDFISSYLPKRSQSGNVNISASSGTGNTTVSFASSRFTSTPNIVLTTDTAGWIASIGSYSSSSFGINIVHRTGSGSGTVKVFWHAIQDS